MKVIPATPGWIALFAFGCPNEDPDVEVYTNVIAAWKVDDDGCLVPITAVERGTMAPADCEAWSSDGTELIDIIEPGQPLPDLEEQRQRARLNYKIRTYLEKHTIKNPGDEDRR